MDRPSRPPLFSMEDDWFGCIVGLAIILVAEAIVRIGA